MKILVSTNNHLGDAIALTAAIHNAKLAFPEIRFDYEGNYGDVFANNEDITWFNHDKADVVRIFVNYSPFSQKRGDGGNLCEAYSRNLAQCIKELTGKSFDIVRTTPFINLTSEELSFRPVSGNYVIVNANCQKCSEVKRYPYYQQIIDDNPDIQFVQVGGKESRDVTFDLKNVIDLRGKTNIRELLSLVFHSDGVVSPSSAIIHASATFGIKAHCIIGARESKNLTGYDNVVHYTSQCGKYDCNNGCMKFHIYTLGLKRCTNIVEINGNSFASCMSLISPSEVSQCLR